MKYGVCFLLLTTALLMTAIQSGIWYFVRLYPAISFTIVALGYFGAGLRIFGKSSDGKRKWLATFFLLPYLLLTLVTWHLIRVLSRESPVNQLDTDFLLSRRLLGSEMPDAVRSVVDLAIAKEILDLPKPALIHCAQGHGRTGLIAAAVLIVSGKAQSSKEAISMVKAVRPGIELNSVQRKILEAIK